MIDNLRKSIKLIFFILFLFNLSATFFENSTYISAISFRENTLYLNLLFKFVLILFIFFISWLFEENNHLLSITISILLDDFKVITGTPVAIASINMLE